MQYTTDPNAIHQYMSSRNRTARWVNSHYASETDFDSPSIPPLELAGMIPSSPSSEASSCDSLPPMMVLRYKDGRPDIPIPKLDQYGQVVRHPSRKCKRGGHESRHACNDEEFSPTHPPEEIRILPFNGSGVAPSHHTRSRSLPRGFDSSETSETTLSSAEPAAQSGYILPPSTSHLSRNAPPSHSNFATWYDNPPSKAPNGPRAPPSHMPSSAISYSPEVPLATPQYAPPPPGGYYYPHNMGPGGVVYSHSTPVASSYHHPSAPATAAGPTYVHPAISHKHRSRFDSEHTPRSKSATGFRAGDHPLLPGRVSYDSGPGAGAASGAYYVLQTTPAGGGQRVHPIVSVPKPRRK